MLKTTYSKHIFKFNFPGGTSRGVLNEKPSWFLKIYNTEKPHIIGNGEISIIPGLSPETEKTVELLLNELIQSPDFFINNYRNKLDGCPAIKFGIETALADLQNGGSKIHYPSEFTNGNAGIKINGLVWMGNKDEMLNRIKEKVKRGFTCIKIKVGAINFNEELDLLKFIRKNFSEQNLEIRVDANGAFSPKDVFQKLESLSKYKLHSIEQPIKAGQWETMHLLCKNTPLPIALDEELIGIENLDTRKELLDTIKPQYIILKPSLVGGLADTKHWSELAEQNNIGWWVTSALESNIGLNAIAQWTYTYGSNMPQGLGTGSVFSNNIASPLEIQGEKLWHNTTKTWEEVK